MKKITALFLILVLSLSAFMIGCEDEPTSSNSPSSDTSEKSEEASKDEEKSKEVSDDISEEVSEEEPLLAHLYQVSPDTSMLMNCYIIKTVSNKLIVIDGGGVATREKTSGYLYKELQKMSGQEVPEIEAWILTHMHDDHVTEFCLIGNDENKPIKVNKMYFNFPEYSFFEVIENGRFAYLHKDVESAYDNLFGKGEFEKCGGKTAFEGDVIEIDGLKIEIMLTYSDEVSPTNINDTSMIFRVDANGQKVLFLGDAHIAEGDRLYAKFGDDLKSDIVQMSHHGQGGVRKEVYDVIAPTLCMWPSADWVFDDWNGNLSTFETRQWMIDQGVKYHLITGRYKTQVIELPNDFKGMRKINITVPKK